MPYLNPIKRNVLFCETPESQHSCASIEVALGFPIYIARNITVSFFKRPKVGGVQKWVGPLQLKKPSLGLHAALSGPNWHNCQSSSPQTLKEETQCVAPEDPQGLRKWALVEGLKLIPENLLFPNVHLLSERTWLTLGLVPQGRRKAQANPPRQRKMPAWFLLVVRRNFILYVSDLWSQFCFSLSKTL